MDFDLAAGIAILDRTPNAFRACSPASLPVDRRHRRPGDVEPVRHRRPSHPRRARRLDHPRADHPRPGSARRFTPFDRFAQFRESEGKSLTDLLDEFARLRAENLATLEGGGSPTRSWRSKGSIPRSGESRCASCWPRGSRTTSATSRRPHASWRSSTARPSAPGAPTCR